MNKADILSALDEEISRLRQARDLLADASLPTRNTSVAKAGPSSASEAVVKRGPGRPKGSLSKPKADGASAKETIGKAASKSTGFDPKEFAPKRRTMSAEGKARIAAAQRARWARQNGEPAAASKGNGKKDAAKPASATKAFAKATAAKTAKTSAAKKGSSKTASKGASDAKKGAVKKNSQPGETKTSHAAATTGSE